MKTSTLLDRADTVLLIIDVQDKLASVMHRKEKLVENVLKIIKGITVLELPAILTEQYPAGLGKTLPEISQLLPHVSPIEKVSFSCYNEEPFRLRLESLRRKRVLVTGIEAHICIYQTTVDLQQKGYQVQVVTDCVSSRNAEDKQVSLARLSDMGIGLTTAEMALFELLRVAAGEKFQQISRIVK